MASTCLDYTQRVLMRTCATFFYRSRWRMAAAVCLGIADAGAPADPVAAASAPLIAVFPDAMFVRCCLWA